MLEKLYEIIEKDHINDTLQHLNHKSISVTDIVLANAICPRQLYMFKHFVILPDRQQLMRLTRGKVIHKFFEELFARAFPNAVVEKDMNVTYNSVNIVFRPDVIIDDKVIELKTVSSLPASSLVDKVYPHYVLQTSIYAFLLKKKGWLVLIGMKDFDLLDFPVQAIEQSVFETLLRNTLRFLDKEPDPVPIASWACKYCYVPCPMHNKQT
jgi:CRISPR/Cas system-associated exonuclease Cas4 (RecB family)